jgi:hypothetical protein
VNSEAFELDAAVGFSVSTCDTVAARKIRLNSTAITGPKAARVVRDFGYFHPKLMAQSSRICEKRLLAPKCVQVSPADSNSPHANDRFTGARRLGRPGFLRNESTRLLKDNFFHSGAFSSQDWLRWTK